LWNFLTVLVCIALYESWLLPESINFKKVEERVRSVDDEAESGSEETKETRV
jgi:hypothetical protein